MIFELYAFDFINKIFKRVTPYIYKAKIDNIDKTILMVN